MSAVDWQPCLMGWCEKAYHAGALLHVVGQTSGKWWWEAHGPEGVGSAEGMEDDKATAQRRAVEHAERKASAEGQHGSEEEG